MKCFFCERELPEGYKLDVCQDCTDNGVGDDLLQDLSDVVEGINKKLQTVANPMHKPDCICNTKGLRDCDCGLVKPRR